LIEAPAGTVLWSHSTQVALGDIFQLQDTLARQIVESLALPLSASTPLGKSAATTIASAVTALSTYSEAGLRKSPLPPIPRIPSTTSSAR
jgi:hypothetical protein